MKNIIKVANIRRLLIVVLLCAAHQLAYTQARFISVFGNNASACNQNNSMSCVVTPSPSSFAGIATLIDYYGIHYNANYIDHIKNSCYNSSGQLLFSANANGFYAPSGNQVYAIGDYSTWLSYTPPACSTSYQIQAYQAVSEICIIPIHCQPNQYYALCWVSTADYGCTLYPPCSFVLMAYQVNIDQSLFPADAAYTVTPYVLIPPTCTGYADFGDGGGLGSFCVAADAYNSDWSRDIYTIDPRYDASCSCTYQSEIRKWHLDPTGALASTSVLYPYSGSSPALSLTDLQKAKILSMPAPPGHSGTDKYLCFTGHPAGLYDGVLQTFDLTLNQVTTSYVAPLISCPHTSTEHPSTATSGAQQICGFEYLPSPIGQMVFTFTDYSFADNTTGNTIPSGAICYAASPGSSSSVTMAVAPFSAENYLFSDLELDKKGDLLLVNQDLPTGDGKLYYMPTSTLSSLSALLSSSTAAASTPACSAYPYIPVYNQMELSGHSDGQPYYLGTQIRNEDYESVPGILPNYTVAYGTTETWTPTSNPVTNITGIPVTTIQANSIEISPYGYLSISGMTLEMAPGSTITIDPATSSSGYGGYLYLDHSTLTANNSCASSSTWGGIRVVGVPSYSQALSALPGAQHQGALNINYTTVSYADVAIQNGNDPGSSGGYMTSYYGNNLFYNNKLAWNMFPYHNMISGVEYRSMANMTGSTFNTDASAWFLVTNYVHMNGINGGSLWQNHFENHSGSTMLQAVMSNNSSMIYEENTVGNATSYLSFQDGIYDMSVTGTTTSNVQDNIFNNCQWGYVADGAVAPRVNANTFNIPPYSGAFTLTAPPNYPGSNVLIINDQNIGAFMYGNTGFNMTGNIFNGSGTSFYPYTSGTVEWSTGSDNNQVTDNTFVGLGVAMNSNFKNTDGEEGLLYLCNSDTHDNYDIHVAGHTSSGFSVEGINPAHFTVSGSGVHEPAGNIFSGTFGSVVPINIFNTEVPIIYTYSSLSGPEHPATIVSPSTVSLVSSASHGNCYALLGHGPYKFSTSSLYSMSVPTVSGNVADVALKYAINTGNVNYYLTDTIEPHRDSVYYWAEQMGTAYGDLLIANLLVEDSLIDSANTIYDSIILKYSLTGAEANEFVQGRYLMNLLIAKRAGDRDFTSMSSDQIATLHSIKANATMWAHVRAEGWLYMANSEAMMDTLLYPPADTLTDTSGGGGGEGGRFSPAPNLTQTPEVHNMVFPNPVHDYLQVIYTGKSADDVVMQLEDISGRKLISQSIQNGIQSSIDISFLSPGIYIYRIFEGSRVTMIGKVTKE